MNNEYFKIYASVVTHVGNVRKNNEDNFYFFDHYLDDTQKEYHLQQHSQTKTPLVFGVFDGMGGHEHGEKASLITAITTQNKELNEFYLEDSLEDICYEANQLVCDEMRRYKVRIGSTASLLALYQNQASICNIGDTPIYLYRDHLLTQLHEEHTEKRMYERIYGYVDPQKKYRLTQNIGVFEEEVIIKPYTSTIELLKGDILMICSDGLTDMVSEDEISHILDNHSIEQCGFMLRDAALKAGGRDNITIILIQIENKKRKSIFDYYRGER